jgi:hypothetical protein
MFKSTIVAMLTGTALLASGAAFADRKGHGHGYGHRHVVVKHYHHRPAYRPVVVQRHYHQRPVVVQRHVVVQRPVVVHRPAPVIYHSDPGAGLAILAGAAIGGVIAYHIANGN